MDSDLRLTVLGISYWRGAAFGDVHFVRVGTPERVGARPSPRAGDEGSWINGQVINVDGGTVMR